ncbi:ABC transporter ATP-binding protein [Caldalkalibacillus mannanilyticus]|uniref:ABC transporter ATP-binding protein n=1 Tax=Caldalkalibacillus mannanilyticus TaxID=1418 RepID=UPI0004680855|nr:ABC transporter ATP-binding protein [Caldalkalibacillus mannanilyticus]
MSKLLNAQKKPSLLREIGTVIRPYSFWLMITIVFSILVSFVEIFIGVFIQKLTAYTIQDHDQGLLEILLGLIVCVAGGFLSYYLIKRSSVRLGAYVIFDLRKSMVEKIDRYKFSTIEKYHSGDFVSRVTHDTTVLQRFFTEQFPRFIYEPLMLIGAFTYLLVVNWKLILVSLSVIPIALIITHFLSKPLQGYTTELQKSMGTNLSVVKDTIHGIHIVKVFHLYHRLFHKYQNSVSQVLHKSLQIEFRQALINPVQIFIMSSPIVVCILFASYLISKNELRVDGLIVFIYLLGLILQNVSSIPELFVQGQKALGSYKRISEVLAFPLEESSPMTFIPERHEEPICFENIDFSYQKNEMVLRDVSFSVKKYQKVAIIGPSGSGKTTFFKLLCGFYPVQNGKIKVFGVDVNNWDTQELRSKIALVSQDIYLFPNTIAENIAYGNLNATHEEIVEAAKLAHAHSFIMELPQGYQTILGENGFELSGGQKQRIAIARAFLKDAPLLLLDEPTSALDTHTEELVNAGIRKLSENRTVLVISHRLSTIQDYDLVWELKEGVLTVKQEENDSLEELKPINSF